MLAPPVAAEASKKTTTTPTTGRPAVRSVLATHSAAGATERLPATSRPGPVATRAGVAAARSGPATAPVRAVARGAAPTVQPAGPAPSLALAPRPAAQGGGLGLGSVINGEVDDLLTAVPGWRLLTVVLGYNPVLGQDVPRDAPHIIEGVLQLAGGPGALAYKALERSGMIKAATTWLAEHTQGLSFSLAAIRDLAHLAWKRIHLLDGFAANLKVVQEVFGPTVKRLLRFATDTKDAVVGWLQQAVFEPMARKAQETRGYTLFTVLLGFDPLTGQKVPRTADSLGHAVLKLLPDGEAMYARFKQLNAMERLQKWFEQQAATKDLTLARVQRLLVNAGRQLLSWNLLLHPLDTAGQLVGPFLQLSLDVWSVVGSGLLTVLEMALEVALGPARSKQILHMLRQAGDLLMGILQHPLPFLKNLLDAGWLGFKNFLKHGLAHLGHALQDWLLGGLQHLKLELPTKFDVPGVVKLVLSVFGLSKDAILGKLHERLVKIVGAENAERIEELVRQVGEVAVTLFDHGPAAAWEKIQDAVGDLKEKALSMVKDAVLDMAKTAVPKFLAKLVVPGGAFLSVAEGIWATLQTFLEKGKQIVAVGRAFFESVQRIAAGDLGPAAQKVEDALVKLLPVALHFLAGWLGLGGITTKIQEGLEKVRRPVEKGVDKVLDKVAEKAGPVWAKMQAGVGKLVDKGKAVVSGAVSKVSGWLGLRQPFKTPTGEQHTLFVQGSAQQAQLMVASTPQLVATYLREQKVAIATLPERTAQEREFKKGQPARIQRAIDYLKNILQPITHANQDAEARRTQKPGDEKAIARETKRLAQEMADHLQAFGQLLAEIGGLSPAQLQAALPPKADFNAKPRNSYPKSSAVHYLSVATSGNGEPKIPASEAPPGWALLKTHKQTSAPGGHWVQMHMVSAAIGGLAKAKNLVPAPHAVNRGSKVNSFEDALKRLVAGQKAGTKPAIPETDPAHKSSVVWVEVSVLAFHGAGTRNKVDYPAGVFPQDMTFQAGIYYYAGGEWTRDDKPRIREDFSNMLLPSFEVTRPTALNNDGRYMLVGTIGCSHEFAGKLLDERKSGEFKDYDDARRRVAPFAPDYVKLFNAALDKGEAYERAKNAGDDSASVVGALIIDRK